LIRLNAEVVISRQSWRPEDRSKMRVRIGLSLCCALAVAARALAQVPTPPLSHADAVAIAQALAQAKLEGIESPDAGPAVAALDSPDPAARDAADATLSAMAIGLAGAEHGMRIDPSAEDPGLALRPPYNAAADFAAVRRAGRVADWVRGLAPSDPAYQRLVAARGRYATIVSAGGWPIVPPGKPLKPGATDPRAPVLRQRLLAEGYVEAASPLAAPLVPPSPPDLFDPSLAAALRDFQTDHALKADGILTAQTTDALDTPAEARLAAIDANLERERWLPRELPADRIEVDTGDPRATLFEGGAPVLTMRAIAGEPTKRTPTFASKVVAIEFNPPWIVPADIAAKELYPKERRSPGYFARNDLYVANGQLIQKAGPKSSLGYLKFVIPDPFDVYLHDTPARTLFDRDKRWLSHGCVRLQNPRDLAAALLARQGLDRAAIDAAIATGVTYSTPLKVPVPVYVVYRTVIAEPDGRVLFRPDAYGWDGEMALALAAARF
jgi:murein L,D-transpeptidase YcbB/YkuD